MNGSPRRNRNVVPWIASCAIHGAVFLGAILWHVRPPQPPVVDPGVEIELVPRRATPAATTAPAAPNVPQPNAPTPPEPNTQRPREALAHRALPPDRIRVNQGQEPPTGTEPPEQGTIEPPTGPSQPASQPSSGPRILTASELFGGSNEPGVMAAAAQAGGVDLGRPGSGYRPSRNLWDRPRTGSRIDQIREAAAGPTLAALAGSNHMQAAGTAEHDSRVARRAEEVFNPVRTIANLGEAVLRAPRVGLPPVTHELSGGEAAAGATLDVAHGSSFTMMQPGAIPVPPVHTMRADVEVDQDARGAVLATRVVRRSGLAEFDRAALEAIREVLPDAPTLNDGGRRSRWAFEVSESAGAIGMALGGGNQGWREISEPSGGVRLRYRVRRVDSRPLQGS